MYRSERFTLSLCLPRCLSLCPRLLSAVSRERVWGRSPGKWELPFGRRHADLASRVPRGIPLGGKPEASVPLLETLLDYYVYVLRVHTPDRTEG